MKVYNYGIGGVFVGESDAKIDPKETAKNKKDKFLIPARATLSKPPSCSGNEVAVFADGEWSVVRDNIGAEYYLPDSSEQLRMASLGPLPDGAILGVNPAIAEAEDLILAEVETAWQEFDSASSIAALKIALKKILGR